jgi:hypothetical protein
MADESTGSVAEEGGAQNRDLESHMANHALQQERELILLRDSIRVEPTARSPGDLDVIQGWFENNMTSLFRDLSSKKMTDFASNARYMSFGPGEWIVRQDDYADKFYITLTGTMEVFVRNYAQVGGVRG